MITGDNINTALSVAKECQIVPFGRIIVVTAVKDEISEEVTIRYRVNDDIHPDSKKVTAINMEKR